MRIVLRFLASLFALALLSDRASAQVLDPRFPSTDLPIYAQQIMGDTLFIGGDFSSVSVDYTGGFGAFDTHGGQTVPNWPKVNGVVRLFAPDGAGGWYIGGPFDHVAGVPRRFAAHIRADGSLDGWNPDPDDFVYGIARFGDRVYLSGRFGRVGGVRRFALAAVDATTGALLDWAPGPDGDGAGMALVDSTLFVTGRLGHLFGQPRAGIAAFNARSGELLDGYPRIEFDFGYGSVQGGELYTMVARGPILYVGGHLNLVNGLPRNYAAAFDTRTGELLPWTPALPGFVAALAPGADAIYLGGVFDLGAGKEAYLVATDPASGALLPWDPAPNNWVLSLELHEGVLFVGGRFGSIGGQQRAYLAALDPATGKALDFNPWLNDQVVGLSARGDTVFACGWFDAARGRPRRHLAAIRLSSGELLDWNPGTDAPVYALHGTLDALYVGGQFNEAGGQPRDHLSAFARGDGSLLPWNPGANGDVYAICSRETTLYVGGGFLKVAGEGRQHVAALHSTRGDLLPWRCETDGIVRALAASDRMVVAGGDFHRVGPDSTSTLAVLDRTSGDLLSDNFRLDGRVDAIRFDDGAFYIGGNFSRIAGVPRGSLGALDAGSLDLLPWDPRADGEVLALEADAGVMYTSGFFQRLGAATRLFMGAVDPTSGAVLSWNPPMMNSPFSLAMRDGAVYAAGRFSTSGGPDYPRRFNLAKLVPKDGYPSLAVAALGPEPGAVLSIGDLAELTWEAKGGVPDVQSVDLYLSRNGSAGPWELIAAGLPNTGAYRWRVTGPPCAGSALLRVIARDYADNSTFATGSGAFTIADTPVPTLVELFRAVATPDGARVEWKFSDPAAIADVGLERGSASQGGFARVDAAAADSGGVMSVLDREASPDRDWWYRLAGALRDGAAFATAAIPVAASGAVTSFALAPLAPNPTSGSAMLSFAIPARTRVRLSLVDVQGREVALLSDGERPAGRYASALDAKDLRPGLYFVRLQAPGADLRQRVVIVR